MRRLLPLLALSLLASGCGSEAAAAPGTVLAKRGSISQTVTATGAVVASNQSRLSFKISGKIKTIDVQQGDTVSAGRVLATLEADDLVAAVNQAQAQADAARAARAAAEAGVRVAQSKVDQILGSAKPDAIAQALAAADQARAKLADMENGRPESIAQAQAQLDVARQKLAALQSGSREENIRQAQATYDSARAGLSQLTSGPTPQQVAAQKQVVEQAKNALFASQAGRDADVPRGKLTVDQGNAQVAAAQSALNKAQADFNSLVAPPTPQQVQSAQAAVDKTRAALDLARNPYTPEDLKQAQDAVTQAEQGLALARKPFSPDQVQQARDAIRQSEAAVAGARKPYTDADVATAREAVEQARAQAEQAKANLATAEAGIASAKTQLAAATLVAPVSGRVLLLNNQVGESVTPSSAPIVMGAGDLVINASIGEANVGKVRPDQDVDITFETFPGQVFKGKVRELAPLALPTQTIVSYLATVTLQGRTEELRPGLTANLKIYVLRQDDAVLVPNIAVQSYQGKDIVLLYELGAKEPRPHEVRVGVNDRENTQILSGLKGDERLAVIGKKLNGS